MANYPPQQVTDLLRKCSVSHICAGCPLEGTSKCDEELMKMAAESIEELSVGTAEFPWILVTERKPDLELQEVREKYGLTDVEVIVQIKGANIATVLHYDSHGFVDRYGEPYPVLRWMPMPVFIR